ncbi:zinc finger and BTB domain-containing protein 41 isoform X1 [Zeugodacus cucurbitae]|uniref:zinc finger and BTB domain-containing protein 41 isoform X1 n=1 Tax=Zeugodacus cucurbitae TaxID=28588 RepID=UPI0023D94291|nr:zinc finger and BTB domain-containing protein 41 isoform X1 [Zeugodacus cucurbitae]
MCAAMESSKLQMVSFNAEQMDAVARALRIVADEVYEQPKLELISYEPEEVIELLSESENAGDEDDGSDCEIFGKMCANIEEISENNTAYVEKFEPEVERMDSAPQESNVIVGKFTDPAVLNNDNFIPLNAGYKETGEQSTSGLDSFNEIIDLDDSDNDSVCSGNGANNNVCPSNAELSDEDVKEKKCIVLLDDDSNDSNQQSTSKDAGHQKNSHNLDAFLNYICPQCGVSCGNIKKWNAHTDIVHNFRSISMLNLKTVISRQGQLLYECNTCEKKYISDAAYGILLNHRIQHMTIPNFLRCRLCEERFSSRPLFLKHFRKVHKKIALNKLRRSDSARGHIRFLCPICKKKSANLREWKSHLEIEHDWANNLDEKVNLIRDNLVECKTCLAIFRSKHSLWHLVRHEEHNAFHCKLCKELSSYNIHKVAKHIRIEHLKEKCTQEYRCNYCDKVFSNNPRRICHMNEMHTIQKLSCEICDKEFNSSARLLAHMAKLNHQRIK